MEKFDVTLEGEGKIDSASCERAMLNVPLLRWVPRDSKRVSFRSGNEELGHMEVPLNEYPIAVVQKGEEIHLVSNSRDLAYKGVATVHFYVRSGHIGQRDMSKLPANRIKTLRYSTVPRGDVIANLFDGRDNKPAMAFLLPDDDCEEQYTPVEIIDLASRRKNITLEQVSNLELCKSDGKNLLQMNIPATYAYGLIRAGVAGDLERVFAKEDLDRRMDPTQVRGAEYKVATDTAGTIYVAERVVDSRIRSASFF